MDAIGANHGSNVSAGIPYQENIAANSLECAEADNPDDQEAAREDESETEEDKQLDEAFCLITAVGKVRLTYL